MRKYGRHALGVREKAFFRRQIAKRDGARCHYCKREAKPADLTLDHVIPLSRGGQDRLDNLVLACFPCNIRKGHAMPTEITSQVTE